MNKTKNIAKILAFHWKCRKDDPTIQGIRRRCSLQLSFYFRFSLAFCQAIQARGRKRSEKTIRTPSPRVSDFQKRNKDVLCSFDSFYICLVSIRCEIRPQIQKVLMISFFLNFFSVCIQNFKKKTGVCDSRVTKLSLKCTSRNYFLLHGWFRCYSTVKSVDSRCFWCANVGNKNSGYVHSF